MSADEAQQRDFQRIAEELRRQIAAAGLSQRALAAKLGWGRGYVSQLLTGAVDLKVKHVLEILELLQVPPGEFFARLAEELGATRPVYLTEDSLAEFEQRLRSAVRREVQEGLHESTTSAEPVSGIDGQGRSG